ncbi:MAG: Stp1/IreP family PP2C-type Ser/Thr phosphatase [Oscillospiraceae bacterium]|nr:Stp1/IreP family PP2C-type Ser/Thr phosphatase [Oscillospiraceae bacterium]
MLNFAGKTDVGRHREVNQDCFYLRELSDGAVLAILCDGMGGQNGGQVASENAVRSMAQRIVRDYRKDYSANSIRHMLSTAMAAANSEVYAMSKKNRELSGMGTTAIAALVRDGMVYLLHVGDSRVYLVNGESARQLTRDHSVVQMLVERGEITSEEAKYHPERHFITRALGVREAVEADYQEESVPAGNCVLLCSDGLSNHLDEEDIAGIVHSHDPAEGVEELVERANIMGGTDNITVVLIENSARF